MIVCAQKSIYRVEIIPRSSGEIYISGINDNLVLPPTPDAAIPLETDKLPDYIYNRKEKLCFRPMTEHGKPFICPYPEVKGINVGAGHSHFGIILGPGTGKVLSEMILGEELNTDVSQFSL
jgi:glycine/D-amino acid oxidase-like deaminating enzyme